MLSRTEWDRESGPPVYSLEGLTAWLEAQPPGTRYSFAAAQTCVVGSYLRAHGEDAGSVMGNHVAVFKRTNYAQACDDYVRVADQGEKTYGAALARARALLVERAREATPCT